MAQLSLHAFPDGVEIAGKVTPAYAEILTPDALAFVAKLHRQFNRRRAECIKCRQDRQAALDRGGYTATKHQHEVGTSYFDDVAQVIAGGKSSTTALRGSTEEAQFH